VRAAGEVFDKARFLASLDGNVNVLREIAQLFIEDCPRRLAALREALARRDAAALESAAHLLKGSAGYIGASRMFAAADEVEILARRGEVASVDTGCARLERETLRLVRVLAAVR
jgi:HPt (histidine-containing phosphotransfer) domain-containing protein